MFQYGRIKYSNHDIQSTALYSVKSYISFEELYENMLT